MTRGTVHSAHASLTHFSSRVATCRSTAFHLLRSAGPTNRDRPDRVPRRHSSSHPPPTPNPSARYVSLSVRLVLGATPLRPFLTPPPRPPRAPFASCSLPFRSSPHFTFGSFVSSLTSRALHAPSSVSLGPWNRAPGRSSLTLLGSSFLLPVASLGPPAGRSGVTEAVLRPKRAAGTGRGEGTRHALSSLAPSVSRPSPGPLATHGPTTPPDPHSSRLTFVPLVGRYAPHGLFARSFLTLRPPVTRSSLRRFSAHSTHTRRRPGSARGAKGRRTGRVGHRSLHSSLVTFGARHVSPTGMVRREERSVENSRWTRLTL